MWSLVLKHCWGSQTWETVSFCFPSRWMQAWAGAELLGTVVKSSVEKRWRKSSSVAWWVENKPDEKDIWELLLFWCGVEHTALLWALLKIFHEQTLMRCHISCVQESRVTMFLKVWVKTIHLGSEFTFEEHGNSWFLNTIDAAPHQSLLTEDEPNMGLSDADSINV